MKDLGLLSEDRRRGRVRPTRLALVGGGVILVLAVALFFPGSDAVIDSQTALAVQTFKSQW